MACSANHYPKQTLYICHWKENCKYTHIPSKYICHLLYHTSTTGIPEHPHPHLSPRAPTPTHIPTTKKICIYSKDPIVLFCVDTQSDYTQLDIQINKSCLNTVYLPNVLVQYDSYNTDPVLLCFVLTSVISISLIDWLDLFTHIPQN